MKLSWSTDVHLNFLKEDRRMEYYQHVKAMDADVALITGDIAEAPSVCDILTEFAEHTGLKTYFVLGNHDFYSGQIDNVRQAIDNLVAGNPNLVYLSHGSIEQLSETTALVGQDGWADGRNGDFFRSPVQLNDSRYIVDLKQAAFMSEAKLLDKMQTLADVDAEKLAKTLSEAAIMNFDTIYIATHVPPFREACWYEGRPSNDDFVPYFSSRATGDVVDRIAHNHPDINFVVLCGHTHTKHAYQHSENLRVLVGAAEYYHPDVEDLINI